MIRTVAAACLAGIIFSGFVSPPEAFGADAVSPEATLLSDITRASRKSQKIDACLKLARWYAAQGKAGEKALQACEQALKENPSTREKYSVFLLKGDIFLEQREYAAAIEAYQEAISILPRAESAHLRLARAYKESELFELSKQEYLTVLKMNHRSFDAHFGLASLYLEQGLNSRALDSYRTALTLKAAPGVYRMISLCAENQGDIDLAIAMLLQIIASERTYDDEICLGRLYEEQKKFREAEEAFSRAIKLNSDRVEGYMHLGLLSLRRNDLTPAEKLLQIAREKAPREGTIHFFLGYIYYRQNNMKLARTEIEEARKLARTKTLTRYSTKLSAFLDTKR